jgi:hypothetical protein
VSLPQLALRLAATVADRLASRAEREWAADALVALLLPAAVELDRHGADDLGRRILRELEEAGLAPEGAPTLAEALKRLERERGSDFDAWARRLARFAIALAGGYAVHAAAAAAAPAQQPELLRAPA